MKKLLYFISLIALTVSCKEDPKGEKVTTVFSAIENTKEETVQDSENQKTIYKVLKKKNPLSNDQLFEILPKDINGKKPTNSFALQVSRQLASGIYGPAESHYNYFIQDGCGTSAIVRNFFDSYKIKPQGPPKTEYIYKEYDGYKTIAFLQPTINRNYIRFIYNNRFQITLEGADSADVLWTYLDFEILKKLDQYN